MSNPNQPNGTYVPPELLPVGTKGIPAINPFDPKKRAMIAAAAAKLGVLKTIPPVGGSYPRYPVLGNANNPTTLPAFPTSKDLARVNAPSIYDAGLGTVLGPTGVAAGNASAAAKKKPPSSSGTKKSSSSSGGTPAKSGQDMIKELYDNLIGELGTQKTGSLGAYDETKQTITNQYDAAKADLYQKYMATQNPIAEQAANLGVDYKNSSINALQDAALKRLEETGDLSLASDQSYLDKMKLIQSGAFDSMIQGSRNDQTNAILAAQQAAAARAAAGRRSSSGGGGGGSPSGSASSVSTAYDFGINSLLKDLQGDPTAYNYAQRLFDTTTDPQGALKQATYDATFNPAQLQKLTKNTNWGNWVSQIPKIVSNKKTVASNKKGTELAKIAEGLRSKLRQISKQYGAATTVDKVTNRS